MEEGHKLTYILLPIITPIGYVLKSGEECAYLI